MSVPSVLDGISDTLNENDLLKLVHELGRLQAEASRLEAHNTMILKIISDNYDCSNESFERAFWKLRSVIAEIKGICSA